MVAGQSDGGSGSTLTPGSPAGDWLATLQQALRVEAERGFSDLQGRQECFSAFLTRSCGQPPDSLTRRPEDQRALAELAAGFEGYSGLSPARRQTLVRQCRERLHALRRSLEPPASVAPPRLPRRDVPSPAAGGRSATSGDAGNRRVNHGQATIEPDTPLGAIHGIGARTATQLAAMGLLLARDLVRHYPRDYVDYANLARIGALRAGETATVVATVKRCHAFASPRNPNLSILELQLQDITGRLRVSRFLIGKRFSTPGWLKAQQRQFPPGCMVVASGLVKTSPYGPCFQDPLMEVLEGPDAPLRSDRIGRLLPVYALTEGLNAERLRQALRAVLEAAVHWPDPLPAGLRQREALKGRGEALHGLHDPRDRDQLQASRHRLVFDEFLLLQLRLLQRRQQQSLRPSTPLTVNTGAGSLVGNFLALLPFPLTAAQQRVLVETRADMARGQPMARLVQGDVGSGKTVVAVAALLTAIAAGCQGALMAPTEVLAEQHARKLGAWLPQLHVRAALLTGSTPQRRRR